MSDITVQKKSKKNQSVANVAPSSAPSSYSTEDLQSALQKHFGFNQFKGSQEDIIRNVLDGKDTFVIMPTGGRKIVVLSAAGAYAGRHCHNYFTFDRFDEKSGRCYQGI